MRSIAAAAAKTAAHEVHRRWLRHVAFLRWVLAQKIGHKKYDAVTQYEEAVLRARLHAMHVAKAKVSKYISTQQCRRPCEKNYGDWMHWVKRNAYHGWPQAVVDDSTIAAQRATETALMTGSLGACRYLFFAQGSFKTKGGASGTLATLMIKRLLKDAAASRSSRNDALVARDLRTQFCARALQIEAKHIARQWFLADLLQRVLEAHATCKLCAALTRLVGEFLFDLSVPLRHVAPIE